MTTPKPTREAAPRSRRPRLACLLAALGLLFALAGCGGPGHRDSVTIMVPWTQPEEFQAFYRLVKDFEDSTGFPVDVQVTRALTQQLDASVQAGAPPDLAVLPSAAAVIRYAEAKTTHGGRLRPLDGAVDVGDFQQPFRGLAQVDGVTYAVPVKVDVKSLVWYDPRGSDAPADDASWRSVTRQTGLTWCLGLESGPTSGWPGADWIADLLLADAGADTYAKWVSGELPWTSAPVRKAWSDWHDDVGREVLKGAGGRDFAAASKGMTKGSPKCRLAHGARSALAPGLRKDSRFTFAAPEADQPIEVSGDFVGMFGADNPGARAFVSYLAGAKAQQAWVDAAGTAAFSAHRNVTRYANPVQQRIARMLRPGEHTLCFSAADAMSPDVAAAFYRTVLDYAGRDKDPDTVLADLQKVQDELGGTGVPRQSICADPT
ncbi:MULTISPECIES: ABC transporter substrate-binding protein [unclassified Streptomyces]|uniref:ABC transporter substrate-binding protein n=1 Tax=unclassified Streptomyces TaxID=2593676 RepID=UPI00278C5E69|nr:MULTISPECIES: extracellular solute-binding protein [unclassified Streptomyces]